MPERGLAYGDLRHRGVVVVSRDPSTFRVSIKGRFCCTVDAASFHVKYDSSIRGEWGGLFEGRRGPTRVGRVSFFFFFLAPDTAAECYVYGQNSIASLGLVEVLRGLFCLTRKYQKRPPPAAGKSCEDAGEGGGGVDWRVFSRSIIRFFGDSQRVYVIGPKIGDHLTCTASRNKCLSKGEADYAAAETFASHQILFCVRGSIPTTPFFSLTPVSQVARAGADILAHAHAVISLLRDFLQTPAEHVAPVKNVGDGGCCRGHT